MGKKGPGVKELSNPLYNEPGRVRVYYFNAIPTEFVNKMNNAVVPTFAYNNHTAYSRNEVYLNMIYKSLSIYGDYGLGIIYAPGV